jgi:hypothetical protein
MSDPRLGTVDGVVAVDRCRIKAPDASSIGRVNPPQPNAADADWGYVAIPPAARYEPAWCAAGRVSGCNDGVEP